MLNGHFGTSKTQSTVLYYRIKKKTKHTKSSNEILLQNSRYDDQPFDLFSRNYSSWECKFQTKNYDNLSRVQLETGRNCFNTVLSLY